MTGYRSAGASASGGEGGRKPLSVSDALEIVKGTLKGIRLTIVGEVSEVSAKRGYKAVYFTLKDRCSTLKCLMWNDIYRSAGVDLQVGQEVEVTGFFSLYAARGTMNFDVRRLSLAGEGKLRMEVAKLARKLQAEGLMDPARKRPLPEFPDAIGLVTSPRGDAVHDVLRTLRRRWPMARVLVAGVQVEGPGAEVQLIAGLECLFHSGAQLIILGRGGGSYESMMPFNDEGLARAIAACPVPVVTGIGHEPDNFIADMVADVRASTPTWAAAAACPDQQDISQFLDARAASLTVAAKRAIERSSAQVARLADRPVLRDADSLFAQEAMGVDHLAARLEHALPEAFSRFDAQIRRGRERLSLSLGQACRVEQAALDRQRERTRAALSQLVDRFGREMALRAARLGDLSPLAILGRGYSIARDDRDGIVKSVDQAEPGSALKVSVSDGVIDCRVEGVRRVETASVPMEGGR